MLGARDSTTNKIQTLVGATDEYVGKHSNIHIYIHVYTHTHTCIYAYIQGPAEVTPLSVIGRVRECLTQEGQQFENFT